MTKPQSLALAGWFAIGIAGVLCSASAAKAPTPALLVTDHGVLVRNPPPAPAPIAPVPGPPAPISGATLAAIMLAISRRRG